MSDPKETVAALIAEAIADVGATMTRDAVRDALNEPKDPELGDLAFPVFPLARELRKAPPLIATELAAALTNAIDREPTLRSVRADGGYVNIRLDLSARAARALREALTPGFGGSSQGEGHTIGIDFSSPNIAKPFGVGHLRSTAIGQALANIYEALGYRVVRINHLGDWGTQFGKLMAAFERWGDEDALNANPIQHLYDLYVAFHNEAATNEALNDEGRAWFMRLESGDASATAYWSRFRALSIREFERIYARLGVTFDHYWGEAHYNTMLDALIQDVEASGLAETSEGALVVPLDELELPPCLIRKSDGTTLYATRDLAAARYRYDALQFERFLYVVGVGQTVHFRQVFQVLKKMGYPWADACVHVPFGLIQGISTRKGTLVFLDDILDTGRDLVREIVDERPHLSDEEKDQIAEDVAIGAVVFYDLSRNRIKDYEFNWDLMLRGLRPGEPGRTGVYLQYTHVRLGSVIQTYENAFGPLPDASEINAERLSEALARDVIAWIEKFPSVVQGAAAEYEPSQISRYLLELAGALNSFYSGGHKIVSDDAELSAARITLVAAVRSILGRGLDLLGVPKPDRM